MKRLLLPAALAAVAGATQAGVTDNLVVSPRAMSLGNAVTADPGGIEAIHFNPAGLANLGGDWETNTLFIASIRAHSSFESAPDIDLGGFKDDPLNHSATGPVRQAMAIPIIGIPKARLPAVLVPGLGLSWNKPGSKYTFATGTYLSQAFSIDRSADANDPGRFDGKLVQIQRLVYLSPAVGYKLSDTVQVGVAVPIAYANFAINTDFRAPNKLLGTIGALQKGVCPGGNGNIIDTLTFGLCGGGPEGMLDPFKKGANIDFDLHASFDPTINLGVLWEPKPWLTLGAVYQGGADTTYTGRYQFHADPMFRQFVKGLNASLLGPIIAGVTALPQDIPEYQRGNMTAQIPFPYRIQVGAKLKLTDYVQLNVDAAYADWKKWNQLTFTFDQSIKLLELARLFGHPNSAAVSFDLGFRSVVNYSYGLQIMPTRKLTLRLGYEPRKSSIPGNKISLLTPLPDTRLKSLGLRYGFDDGGELDLAASIMKGTYHVPARSDCNLNCDGFFNIIYNPYAATDVRGDLIVRYAGLSYTRPF